MPIEPFTIHVSDEAIAELKRRLAETRWPNPAIPGGWDYGTDQGYLEELCAYWRDGFDWRAQAAQLNAMPQFRATVDGYGLHFVHAKGRGPDPLPLVFSHGWPGSFYEVHKILGPLIDPARHGGRSGGRVPRGRAVAAGLRLLRHPLDPRLRPGAHGGIVGRG